MERKRAAPARPLTTGRAPQSGGRDAVAAAGRQAALAGQQQGGGQPGAASELETAQGALSFVARVLTQTHAAAQQAGEELGDARAEHAAAQRRGSRLEQERAAAAQKLEQATTSLAELRQEVQSERARHDATKAALADERAAHAETERARQRAQDELSTARAASVAHGTGFPDGHGRRSSAAGVGAGLSCALRPAHRESPAAAAAASPPAAGAAAAVRRLDTPFRSNVESLRTQLERHQSPEEAGSAAAESGAGAAPVDMPAAHASDEPDRFGGGGASPEYGAEMHVASHDGSDEDAEVDDEGGGCNNQDTAAPGRPARSRQPPTRWQDDPMSAVDLGGKQERMSAVQNGEVDVSGSFVRRKHDPEKHGRPNNSWAQVHQPPSSEGSDDSQRSSSGRRRRRRTSGSSSLGAASDARRSARPKRSSGHLHVPDVDQAGSQPPPSRRARDAVVREAVSDEPVSLGACGGASAAGDDEKENCAENSLNSPGPPCE